MTVLSIVADTSSLVRMAAIGFALIALADAWTLLDAALAFASVSALGLIVAGGTAVPRHRRSADATVMAPLIAIVGCDGSGKSTLSTEMHAWLAAQSPTALCYLGLGSGDIGNRIKAWPLIGPAVERALADKARQTRSAGKRIPGLWTALVVFGFSLARRRRFRRMLALRRSGVTVITDRYPQTEVSGFYDGPGLSAAAAGSRPVAWLARRERAMYQWMSGFVPDVVLRLNVDLATAYARKPDHAVDSLRAKVAATPLLRFNGAAIVDLDSRAPYRDMSRGAFDVVRRLFGTRGIELHDALA